MYYINPWIFYVISLITSIQIACISVVAAGGIICFIGLLVGPLIIDDITDTAEKKEAYLKTFWKWMKRFPLIFLVCTGIAVITPSEETMYKMMIASKVSADDVDHVIQRLDDVVDSIIESKEQADGTGN